MEITTNETMDKHDSYEEYNQEQIVAKLDIGDKVELRINDNIVKTYTTKYINSHVNIVVQDKGEKTIKEII